MRFSDSEFYGEMKNLFSKYIGDKALLNKLMSNLSKVYEELEMPSRYRSHGATFEELEALKDSLNMVVLNKNLLENILLDLEGVGEKVFLNQYELKLVNLIEHHLKDEKELKELDIDIESFTKGEIISESEKKQIVNLIENFSEILQDLNADEGIKKIDERRAKEYDKTLYKKVKKIKYI